MPKTYAVSLLPSLLQRDLQTFSRVIAFWRKRNNHIFQGLLDIGSKLTLTPGDPKCVVHQSEQELIHGGLVQVPLRVGPVGP